MFLDDTPSRSGFGTTVRFVKAVFLMASLAFAIDRFDGGRVYETIAYTSVISSDGRRSDIGPSRPANLA